MVWRPTSAGRPGQRHDDVFFITRKIGWAINSDGKVIGTKNSGESWTTLSTIADVNDTAIYLRVIHFADEKVGFLGTASTESRIYKTVDGGYSWTALQNLPADAPRTIAGLSMVGRDVVYATGSFSNLDFGAFMKSTDGGVTWTARSLESQASILLDNHFFDEMHGITVGGFYSGQRNDRAFLDMRPVILETRDGGETWINLLENFFSLFPGNEYGFRIHVVNRLVIYVSMQNSLDGAVAKTTDGGKTWIRLRVNDKQGNVNIEGVGFVNEKKGWVGGFGSPRFKAGFSSVTDNGGMKWKAANDIGLYISRFRFFGCPVNVGFAAGEYIYKYGKKKGRSKAVVKKERRLIVSVTEGDQLKPPVDIKIRVRKGAKLLRVTVFNRMGRVMRKVISEDKPKRGVRVVPWDGRGLFFGSLFPVADGLYIVRVRVDKETDSQVLFIINKVF